MIKLVKTRVSTERLEDSTSVPEALLLALSPNPPHIISVDMAITHGALCGTEERLDITSG